LEKTREIVLRMAHPDTAGAQKIVAAARARIHGMAAMGRIAERLAEVRGRIDAAARRAGRSPESVTLVAVAKGQPAESVRAAFEAGCRDVGESYVQELVAKTEALALDGLRWHHIGHLQRNKVKAVVGRVVLVHGVDSTRLLAEIDRRAVEAGARVAVLAEVNLAAEASKSGCAPAELGALLAAADRASAVELRGLMAIPPAADDAEPSRRWFRELAALRDAHGGAARLPELSMGMSHDYELAVEEGATLVRVGTAIFGERPV
jgi:pyridoxal phosphate enzyme (YggS family)